jgi:purine-nucleoside phosphorylase
MNGPSPTLWDRMNQSAHAVREALGPDMPAAAVVLGSGLGGLADAVADARSIAYASIPHFPTTTVAGHDGRLIAGTLPGGARALVLRGRVHSYEGHDLAAVTYPVRVLQALGVRTLVLSAAVGGIGDGLGPGSIVMLSDHINLIGANPLRGPHDDRLGARFPDMGAVYSDRLRAIARDEAAAFGTALKDGVYACLPGPSYETPAEIRMLKALGADVVGMSTVPEAIVARQAGIEVLAFAVVSNWAAGLAQGATITHDEVIAAGNEAGPRLGRLVAAVLARAGDQAQG